MKCPCCGNDMEKGFVKSSYSIFWGKDKGLLSFDDDIKLTKVSFDTFVKGNFIESFYCYNCQKIIISLEQNHKPK